jgi:hypothetical protein
LTATVTADELAMECVVAESVACSSKL